MKVYVITGTHGDYSDRSDWNVCATMSEIHAADLVDKLRQLTQYNEEFRARVQPEFEKPYADANPEGTSLLAGRPCPTREHSILLDKFSHHEGLYEEKEVLRKLQAEYIKKIEDWKKVARVDQELRNKRYDNMRDAEAKWKDENYSPPKKLQEVVPYCRRESYTDTTFNYDEVDLIS